MESVAIIAGLIEGDVRLLRAHVFYGDLGAEVEALLVFEDAEEARDYIEGCAGLDPEGRWVPIPTEVDELPPLCAVCGIGYLAVPSALGPGWAGVGPVLDVVDRLQRRAGA
jgi:hypothetical protein